MKSDAGSEPLDLDRLVTRPEEVRALREARERSAISTLDLLRALARLVPSHAVLRARKGPSGSEPFRL